MQTTAMLMRSSSSPLLECLHLAPFSHTEPSPDVKHDSNFIIAGEAPALLCVSLYTSRGGLHLPATSHHPHLQLDSPAFAPAKLPGWKSCSESPVGVPPSNHMRKAQSENDLCKLGGNCSVTPARVAANSLLQDSLADDDDPSPGSAFEAHNSSFYLPHVKKGRALLPLSRRRSLGSLPAELPSVFFSDDSDFAILEEGELSTSCSSDASVEEGELSTSCSSDASEVDEDRNSQTRLFNKIALPVGEAVHSKHDAAVVLSNLHDEGKTSTGLSENDILQGMVGRQRAGGLPSGLGQLDMVVSSSGRQEPDLALRQSPAVRVVARYGTAATLARGVCEPTSPLKCGYDADNLETAYNGGDGGRGARPPITTGGGRGGGGGDAGGHEGGSSDVADQHYQRVLQKDPGNPLLLQNYAQYLADVKHDYRKAEEFFQRAILASPSDGELLGQYAKMLWEVKHDTERAAAYFERAVQAAPDNSYVMAAHASFLWGSEEEEQETIASSPSDFPASFPTLVSVGLA